MLDQMYIKAKFSLKRALNHLLNEEKGSSEVIALVVVIGIVLIIAFLFRDQIIKLFVDLWNNLVSNNSDNNAESITIPQKPTKG